MKGLRIGRRRARTHDHTSSPLELALRPALADDRWAVPDGFNFARDVVEALAADPKRQALTFIGHDGVIEPRTFLELAEGAAWWRETLVEHGVQPKDRILVVSGSSVHWLEVVLGAMKAGAVVVPCLPSLSARALEARVSSTDATLIVAEHGAQPTIEQMSFTADVHYIDEGRRRSSDVPKSSPTHDTSSRDVAFVFTTPGSSGAPREVAHTHGSIFAARVQAEHWLDAGRGDVVWCTAEADSPLHAWFTLVAPWSRGAEVVLHHGPFDVQERLEHIYRLGPTILCQSPAEYRAISEHHRLERFRAPRLRRLVSTGDTLEPEVRSAFEEHWGLTIHDGYGQAETNVVITSTEDATDTAGAIGRALPGYELVVIDDQGNELPPGIEGDLAVRGHPPTLFAGYWEAPDETKRAFRGEAYVTGDVAVADEDGTFVLVGRAEDVITSSGRTFGPFGIEHLLRAHGAISSSAVVGVRDLQRGGHFVRAFVVPAPRVEGSEQLEAELRHYLGELLPEQQVPREILFVDALPHVAGKVSRSTLRDQPISGRPLWEMPPTSDPAAAEPTAGAGAEAALAAPAVEPAPVPEPAPEPEPTVVEPEPVAIVEPEPVVIEPEPVVIEPEPVVIEPEPVVVEPEPVVVVEPEPFAIVEPEPVVVEPEPVVVEAEPVIAEPEPVEVVEPEPMVAELEPVAIVEPEPEPVVGPAPPSEPEPEPVVESRPEHGGPGLRIVPGPEPEPPGEPDLEPLPDFVVVPGSRSGLERLPPPAPEPDPPIELEPLPDYIVDPSRPQPRVAESDRRLAAETTQPFPGLVRAPAVPETSSAEPSGAEAAGLYFPPVTSFPAPKEDDDADGADHRERRSTRRRPAGGKEAGKTKRKRSLEEPGDDAVGDATWMAGLSNRLSAYSLAEDAGDADEDDAGADRADDIGGDD